MLSWLIGYVMAGNLIRAPVFATRISTVVHIDTWLRIGSAVADHCFAAACACARSLLGAAVLRRSPRLIVVAAHSNWAPISRAENPPRCRC